MKTTEKYRLKINEYFNTIKYSRSGFSKLWAIDKSYIIFSLLINILNASTSILYIFYWKNILEAISDKKGIYIICIWASIMLISQLAENIFKSYYDSLFAIPKREKITLKIKEKIYSHLVKTDYEKYEDPDFLDNYLFSQETYVNALFEIQNSINDAIKAIIMITIFISIVVIADGRILLLVVFNMIIDALVGLVLAKKNYDNDYEKRTNNRIINYIFRLFNSTNYGIEIRCNNYFQHLINKYKNAVSSNEKIQKKNGKMLFFISFISISLLTVFEFFLVIATYHICNKNNYSVGMFSVIVNSIWSLTIQMNQLFKTIPSFYASGLKIHNFILHENVESKIENTGIYELESPICKIEFNNVEFKYNNSNFALKNINFCILKGEKVAIVGNNGSGKSSIIKLLLKIYKPNKGMIKINGIDIQKIKTRYFRNDIGQCLQSNQILAMSIKDFVFNHDESPDVIANVISYTQFDKIMYKNRITVDSQLTKEFSDNGVILSGGESQKLFLTRAFANGDSLLVFDEPSNSLDLKSEFEIFNSILKTSKEKTVIFVSHNLIPTTQADKIIYMEDGKIEEIGSHNDLMKLNNKYAKLYEFQMNEYQMRGEL